MKRLRVHGAERLGMHRTERLGICRAGRLAAALHISRHLRPAEGFRWEPSEGFRWRLAGRLLESLAAEATRTSAPAPVQPP